MRGVGTAMLAAVALSSGCGLFYEDFESIDAACPGTVPGEGLMETFGIEVMRRISCYRTFVNLPPMGATSGVQEAVRAHANYLEQNDELANPFPNYHGEVEGKPGYTAADPFARLALFGGIENQFDYGMWTVVADGEAPATLADDFVEDPFNRDFLFQPYLLGSGIHQFQSAGQDWSYWNVVYALPPNDRVYWPVVYPKPGQTNVPTSYTPVNFGSNPLYTGAPIGFPLTVTVGAYEVTGGGSNPYELVLIDAEIEGPEGVQDMLFANPGVYDGLGDFQASVAMAAPQPLQPGTRYDVRAVLKWNAHERFTIDAWFITEGFGPDTPTDTDVAATVPW